uniref:5-hydroxytryptamine receptor 4 n=1 Tax=Lates calcarifer TaxID=8187 RepID=A0A4W6CD06_LATCA
MFSPLFFRFHSDSMPKRMALICFLSLVMLMSILGNLLVMVAVCKDRQLRKIKTNYFIVSLAFADLLVSVLVMPFGAIELVHQHWIYGETFCLVRTSLDVLLTTASILHLCCIALDRYYAICCQPLVYRNKMTPMRVALMIGGCWVIPTFISFLPIMQGWNSIGIRPPGECCSACVCVCAAGERVHLRAWDGFIWRWDQKYFVSLHRMRQFFDSNTQKMEFPGGRKKTDHKNEQNGQKSRTCFTQTL